MKKIYFIVGAALLSAPAFAQTSAGKAVVKGTKAYTHVNSPSRINSPDTTGIVNVTDFQPEFLPNGGSAAIYGYTDGGYIFGNNVDGLNICAQGYQNLGPIPVNILGTLLWFGAKESDGVSSATSKVVINAYNMAPNKALNTTGSGTFNSTTYNSPGPSGTAKSTANLLFSDIDTINFNYVPFPTPATFVGDFVIAMDASATNLAAGDTVGLVSDNEDDANNADLAFHKYAGKWYVTDQLFSPAASPDFGSGALNNNIAIWAVVEDATGVKEFFNGMKLTTYPNPAVNNVTVEYTLENAAKNVKLIVLDPAGRKIVDNNYNSQSAGNYKVNIETSNLAAGTYFYSLNADGHNFTKQLVITK
jgi:hypothetical protein